MATHTSAGFSKPAVLIIILIPLIVLGALLFYSMQIPGQENNVTTMPGNTPSSRLTQNQLPPGAPTSAPADLNQLPANLPVPKDYPLVQRVLNYGGGTIRYVLGGKIQNFQAGANTVTITYAGMTGAGFPGSFTVSTTTKISYYAGPDNLRPINFEDFKKLPRAGLSIGLGVDYNMNTKSWSVVRETYIPDKQ